MKFINLIPEKGMTYRNDRDVKTAFNKNYNFIGDDMHRRGKIINKAMAEFEKPVVVVIRYNKEKNVCRMYLS